jgi:hypothetical protein
MNIVPVKKTITAGLAVMAVSLGLAVAAPSSASAGNVELYVGPGGAAVTVGSTYRDRYSRDRYHRRAPAPDYRRHATCSPREAVSKARRFGVHRAHVDRVTRRHIVVEGYKRYRGQVKLAFDRNSRHCNLAWSNDRRGGWR